MRWLISLYMLPDSTHHTNIFRWRNDWAHIVKGVEPGGEILISVHQINQALHVMLYRPDVLPCI